MDKPLSIDRLPAEVGLFPAPIPKLITCLFWSFNFPPTPPPTQRKNKQTNPKKVRKKNTQTDLPLSPVSRLGSFLLKEKETKTKTRKQTEPAFPPQPLAPQASRSWRVCGPAEVSTGAASRPSLGFQKKGKNNP